MAAYPARDLTLALRHGTWDAEAVSPQQAAASCSSRRGSLGDSSYARRTEWLGVSYAIEGVFVRVGSRLHATGSDFAGAEEPQWLARSLQTWIAEDMPWQRNDSPVGCDDRRHL